MTYICVRVCGVFAISSVVVLLLPVLYTSVADEVSLFKKFKSVLFSTLQFKTHTPTPHTYICIYLVYHTFVVVVVVLAVVVGLAVNRPSLVRVRRGFVVTQNINGLI